MRVIASWHGFETSVLMLDSELMRFQNVPVVKLLDATRMEITERSSMVFTWNRGRTLGRCRCLSAHNRYSDTEHDTRNEDSHESSFNSGHRLSPFWGFVVRGLMACPTFFASEIVNLAQREK
jgi:hypothetical protein